MVTTMVPETVGAEVEAVVVDRYYMPLNLKPIFEAQSGVIWKDEIVPVWSSEAGEVTVDLYWLKLELQPKAVPWAKSSELVDSLDALVREVESWLPEGARILFEGDTSDHEYLWDLEKRRREWMVPHPRYVRLFEALEELGRRSGLNGVGVWRQAFGSATHLHVSGKCVEPLACDHATQLLGAMNQDLVWSEGFCAANSLATRRNYKVWSGWTEQRRTGMPDFAFSTAQDLRRWFAGMPPLIEPTADGKDYRICLSGDGDINAPLQRGTWWSVVRPAAGHSGIEDRRFPSMSPATFRKLLPKWQARVESLIWLIESGRAPAPIAEELWWELYGGPKPKVFGGGPTY